MLSNTVMGLVALGVLWINTLLVLGAALGRAAEVARLRRSICKRGLARGTLTEGTARLLVEQVGRRGAGATASIVWHDRAHRSSIEHAVVETASGPVLVSSRDAMVWLEEHAVAQAATPAPEAFDATMIEARKARGFVRHVEAPIAHGSAVWVSVSAEEGRGNEPPALISTVDPTAWCRRREIAIVLGFVPATLLVGAAVTFTALVPPVFGPVSEVGAGLGLAFFLLVLPAGTAVRDWARPPHERFVRGRWSAPEQRSAMPKAADAA